MKIKLIVKLAIIILYGNSVFAGNIAKDKKPVEKSPEFTLLIEVPVTEVKDQYRTSTCWSFSTLSMLESELLRKYNKVFNLSEMFIIRKIYIEKAERFIRMHGNMNFAGGGEPNDVIHAIKKYGIVPEETYSGLLSDTLKHNHTELDRELKEYVVNIVKNPAKNLNDSWKTEFENILDKYLGKIPETFDYRGTQYNARRFADSLKLNFDNYIMISSFNHHPYYSSFIIEVPDNWSWGEVYNVTLDELTILSDFVLSQGSSIVWAADNSEAGFDFNAGMAVVPKEFYDSVSRREKAKIQKMSEEEKNKKLFDLNNPVEELFVTNENRQQAFDNYSTTDDHGMHIVGKAKGIDGKQYYYVKNSWGTDNKYSGFLYVSEAYFKYKTMLIMVDKTTLPDDVIQKLNLNL